MTNTHFINGNWTSSTGSALSSTNPATKEILWTGSEATEKTVNEAVTAAKEAFDPWASLPITERIDYLNRFCEELKKHKQELAETISQEMGKPLWDAMGEIGAAIAKLSLSIEAQQERCSTRTIDLAAGLSVTRHRPHGVCAVFGPFNFPFHLPNGHIIPALLAGNTIVLKPSELTPLVAEKMIQLWEKVGIPKGVINLVQGGSSTGRFLSGHDLIKGCFFTGSVKTGKILAKQFGNQIDKILALELGGNNPLIIGSINSDKSAAYTTIQSAYITSGQRCTCARRLIVPKGKKGDKFLEVLVEMIKKVRVGPYTDTPQPFLGPVITEESAKNILDQQRKMVGMGGKPLVEIQQKGAFLSPGLIDVTAIPDRPDEEIFGPLLQVIRVTDLNVAMDEANKTAYGLSAGILTEEKAEYEQFFNHSRAGIINWNLPLTGASGAAPFGGIGISGNHRPSARYAADYCCYPVASMESTTLNMPTKISPGIDL